jgi:hypothetical protein
MFVAAIKYNAHTFSAEVAFTFSKNVGDYKDEQEEMCIATKPTFSIGEFLKKGYQNKTSLKR